MRLLQSFRLGPQDGPPNIFTSAIHVTARAAWALHDFARDARKRLRSSPFARILETCFFRPATSKQDGRAGDKDKTGSREENTLPETRDQHVTTNLLRNSTTGTT